MKAAKKEKIIKELRCLARANSITRLNKQESILIRDNCCCRLCGEKSYLQIHHLTPRSMGGNDSKNNLITLCKSCHLFMHCNPMLTMNKKLEHSNAILRGMERARKLGKPIGKRGKDKKPRKKEGYYQRWKK